MPSRPYGVSGAATPIAAFAVPDVGPTPAARPMPAPAVTPRNPRRDSCESRWETSDFAIFSLLLCLEMKDTRGTNGSERAPIRRGRKPRSALAGRHSGGREVERFDLPET